MNRAWVLAVASCLLGTLVRGQHDWLYYGENDPSHWGEIAGYETCATGTRQSPVNIVDPVFSPELGALNLVGWDSDPEQTWTITNNEHSVQIDVGPGLSSSEGGLPGDYEVNQFHFHWGCLDMWGSEHAVNGERYPMEMHVVHSLGCVSDPTSFGFGMAVHAVFFEISEEDNENFDPIVRALAEVQTADASTNLASFALSSLLPGNTEDFYRYHGSLTTPACNEAVVWTLFRETVNISARQLGEFRSLFDQNGNPLANNFRPEQPLNGRTILSSFPTGDRNPAIPGCRGRKCRDD